MWVSIFHFISQETARGNVDNHFCPKLGSQHFGLSLAELKIIYLSWHLKRFFMYFWLIQKSISIFQLRFVLTCEYKLKTEIIKVRMNIPKFYAKFKFERLR